MEDLLDSAPCGVMAFDLSGRIFLNNATFCSLLGYTDEELKGCKVDFILTMSSRIFHQTHFLPMIKLQSKVEEIYLTLRGKNGESIPTLASATRKMIGGIDAVLCVFMSVRQRGKYEDEILAAKRKAEDALLNNEELRASKLELEWRTQELDRHLSSLERRNLELRQLHEILSHDLKEPVRRISAFSDMISQDMTNVLSEESKDALSRIHKGCLRVNELFKVLQEFLAADCNGDVIEEVNLNSVLSIAVKRVANHETMMPVVKVDELPRMEGYGSQLVTLFEILLRRSINQARDNAALVQIQSKIVQENSYRQVAGKYRFVNFLQLTYRDESSTLDGEDFDAVFELLGRRNHDEVDVGLAICRKIAQNHHGSIKLEANSKGNAIFTVLLPLRDICKISVQEQTLS
ncbi:MAG: PAS domain S-box protein [Verrucomicrobiales bacterium]